MEAVIKLRVDNSGSIIKQVIVCGVPSTEPLLELGEINFDLYGDDSAVTSFLNFFAHEFDKGRIIFRELAYDSNAPE